jgi:hypothetical protein
MSAITNSYRMIKSANPDCVVSITVKVSENSSITFEAISPSMTISRAQANKGYSENVDMTATALASAFTDVNVLRGKSAVVAWQGSDKAVRLLAARNLAGGVVSLIFGDYDKVTQ